MRFKTPELELEFTALHPQVKDLITELDQYSIANGLPEVVVTECLRTPEDQLRIYGIKNKFSWHLCGCAVDLRNSHYKPRELATVVAHLKIQMDKVSKRPGYWEFITEKHGTGAHIHIARKDAKYRDEYLKPLVKSPLTIDPGVTKHQKDEPSA